MKFKLSNNQRDPKTGQFLQGYTGNPRGRPQGARSKLGEAFLLALFEDWQANGIAAIENVRENKPDAYLRIIASVLPKDVSVVDNSIEEMSDGEIIQRLRELDEKIRPLLDEALASDSDENTH